MYRKMLLVLLALLVSAGAGLAVLSSLLQEPSPPDAAAVNRIVKETEQGMSRQEPFRRVDGPYEYTVLGSEGQVLFQTREGLTASVLEALKRRETPLDLTVNSQPAGKLIVHSPQRESYAWWKSRFMMLAGAGLLLFALLSVAYGFYLYRLILAPFARLRQFARHIARGQLDIPLPMDRSHLFGAFTESFDMMREELAAARRNEYLADKSKKELVAGLSHDIRTPVASIKAIVELMQAEAEEEEGKRGRQLDMLYSKADQIDRLISDMFHSTLEELNELQVCITEEPSALLNGMLRNADYTGIITAEPAPDCLLAIDPLRLQQVVDNIVHNARKYAQILMTVRYLLHEGFLEAEFADYGPGVAEEELPHLFNKYYRGSLAVNQSGYGLGLYLSRHLIRRMKGEIECFNRSDGFSVRLLLPLAGETEI